MQSQKIQCPYCSELIPNKLDRCPFCNELLEDIYMLCPACAEKIPKNSIVCPICGERLGANINIQTDEISLIKIKKVLLCLFICVFILTIIVLAVWYGYNWYNDPIRKADRMAKNYYTLAKTQEKEGKNVDAISNYKKALNEKPDFNEIKIPLIKLCIKDRDMECVNEYIESAYKLDKNDNVLKFYYATSIINDQSKSVPLFKSIIEKDPNNYLANKYVGYYYFEKEEYKTALPYLKKSFESQDNFSGNTGVEDKFENIEDEGLMIAAIYIINEQYTNAINILDQIINKTGNYKAKELKAEAIERKNYYEYQKEIEKAEESARKAREKAEAAARKEQEAYERSRREYYREQGINY